MSTTKRKNNDEATVFLPILLGTVRNGRESEHVAKLIQRRLKSNHPEVETQLFDPCLMDLRHNDEGTDMAKLNTDWQEAIIRADGLIIVSPEYNHSFPGSLKHTLDVLLKEYIHKAVGLVGVSRNWSGGVRAVEALLPVVRELGLAVTFTDLYFPNVIKAFDEQGEPADQAVYERIDEFVTELSWMATTLRWGRANVPSRYH